MAGRVLLDTNALLWSLTAPDQLSKNARAAIIDRSSTLIASAASAWEIATKQRLGKLPEADALVFGYAEHLARLGAIELAITGHHALTAGALPWEHRDPFDRMLAAQSILESMPLVTADPVFTHLSGVRVIW